MGIPESLRHNLLALEGAHLPDAVRRLGGREMAERIVRAKIAPIHPDTLRYAIEILDKCGADWGDIFDLPFEVAGPIDPGLLVQAILNLCLRHKHELMVRPMYQYAIPDNIPFETPRFMVREGKPPAEVFDYLVVQHELQARC